MKQMPYYERDVDFDDLAKRDPNFAAISKQGKQKAFIDFQNPKIVQQLTKSLLKCDFNLQVELPDDRLCPPVPVRWNYVRWIQDLLATTSDDYTENSDPAREVLGLDIGVGASCIYGLLACSTRENWRMAGTDIDGTSVEWARKNVKANDLEERIRVKQVANDDPIIPIDNLGVEEMDFVMTNPPFYADREDFERAAHFDFTESSEKQPSAVLTGSQNEMIASGGDVGFVMRIFRESLRLRQRVGWYTAMLSKLSSLQQILAKIKEHGISNFAVTSLHPGHRTKRWAIGWSFRDLRPRNDVGRHGDLVLSILPPVTAQTVKVTGKDVRWCTKKVDEVMKGLNVLRWEWSGLREEGVMECKGNVWSRAARRKKKPIAGETEIDADGEEAEVALAVKIMCRKDEEVEVRWLRGQEYVLFQSFCGMLKRTINEKT
ncbi:hypothetical protein DOTSEDRAFT_42114 [Lecanosticta acicola]|uniref:U6 small nuclear RNA (adenine-(43)-N(6))-methyltransferase n=1 Tax=Lecanosticta acicola TaxID=111012 RepID=A0AAI8Z273_9PEZI|nr:hypothetical protein DOTSEDRAFT_42114 [Lecanosticta acicola]